MLMGMIIPPALSHIAEVLVGVVLILIGLGIVVDIIRKRAHLHFHQHNQLLPHAHWHQHEFVERSEEHTSELQSHSFISYAVFCLKKKKFI